MALSATQLQEAFAVATQFIQKKIPDILTNANYLYTLMMKRKDKVSGGTKIQIPLNFAELDSQGFINGQFDTVSTNQNQQITYGELDWKFYYCALAITLKDITQTENTPTAIAGLIEAKTKAALSSMARFLTEAMHSTGTASNKQFNGFTDIFAASGTAYAGLNNTDVSDWLTEIDTTTANINYTNITSMIGTLRERCQDLAGQDGMGYKPDVMISRQALIDAFKSSEQIKQRFQDNKTLGAGFKGVEIDGVFWYPDKYAAGSVDGSTADNYLYIVSSDSMHLYYKFLPGVNASPLDSKQIIPNQSVLSDVKYLAGNMGCDNRRVNGVFKALVA